MSAVMSCTSVLPKTNSVAGVKNGGSKRLLAESVKV